jgi:hypothetical protein
MGRQPQPVSKIAILSSLLNLVVYPLKGCVVGFKIDCLLDRQQCVLDTIHTRQQRPGTHMILRILWRELSELLTHLECLFVSSVLLIESHQFLATPRVGRIKLSRPQPMFLGRLPPVALVIYYAGIRVDFRRATAKLNQKPVVQNVVPLIRQRLEVAGLHFLELLAVLGGLILLT